MVKGKDWKFTKYLLDKDDVDVRYNVLLTVQEYLAKLNLMNMNDAEINNFLISCGFTRGCAWMKDKIKENSRISTGLFDKNKKEIFLGDICKMIILDWDLMHENPKSFLHIIEFKNAAFGFTPVYPELQHEDDREWKSFWKDKDGEIWNPEYFEVIGNIYENKDLLKL